MATERVTLYRAADETPYTGRDSCWSDDRDSALAYTDNPGFGGPVVWRAQVEVDGARVLDLASGPRAYFGRLADMVEDDDADLAESLRQVAGCAGTDYPWEYSGPLAAWLQERYDWIRYEDDYPEDCVTWVRLAQGSVEVERVCPAGAV